MSLHQIEYALLLMPGLPRGTADEAAARVAWMLGTYPFAGRRADPLRAAMQHTLAVARLRQRRYGEVEALCAPAMDGATGRDDRATVLATMVLARRALGQPYAKLLSQAVALSPDADLVAEAALDAAKGPAGGPRSSEPGSSREDQLTRMTTGDSVTDL